MQSYTHYVGIDISKHTLDVMLWHVGRHQPAKTRLQTSNDTPGHRQLVQWLEEHHAPREGTLLCLEQTGRYDDVLLEHLTLSGWMCALAKTTALKKVRPEHHRKDDRFDADLLAEYSYRFSDKLRLYEAADPVIEQIRLLYRERRRLVKKRTAVLQLRNEQGYNRAGKPNKAERLTAKLWQEQLQLYDRQIQRLEQQMDGLVRSDEDILHRFEQLKGIDGIGPKAALLWLCLFYGQSHLDARQIASRFGVAPHDRISGTSCWSPARSSGHGLSEARKILTMCARSAGAHHEKYRQYKARKLAEGKASHLVTNNIINKLIRVVCAVWNQGATYDRHHVSRFVQTATTTA